MVNSLVFNYLKVPCLLNQGNIWPLFSPHFAVPELSWPIITFMPSWVTGQLEEVVLFIKLWRSLSAL